MWCLYSLEAFKSSVLFINLFIFNKLVWIWISAVYWPQLEINLISWVMLRTTPWQLPTIHFMIECHIIFWIVVTSSFGMLFGITLFFNDYFLVKSFSWRWCMKGGSLWYLVWTREKQTNRQTDRGRVSLSPLGVQAA